MFLFSILLCLHVNYIFAQIYHLNVRVSSCSDKVPSLPEGKYFLTITIISILKLLIEAFIFPNYSLVTTKHYNHSVLERGICVTRTCKNYFQNEENTTKFKENLESCINDTIYKKYELKTNVDEIYYCNQREDGIEVDRYDWIVLGVVGVFIVVNIIGSLYDWIIHWNGEEKVNGNKYMLSFSVKRNWQWLNQSESDDPRIRRLKGFHGVRTITNFLMIYAHVITLLGNGFLEKPRDFEEAYENQFYRLTFNGLMVVHVFFCMSGFLLVYNFLIRVEKLPASWDAISVVMILRWWRLTPIYAVIIAFNATWMRHVGSGPLWNHYVTGSFVRDCRKYWWQHLIYINNYMQDNKFCALHTWYVAADTQLFFIGLVAYVLTMKRGRKVVMTLLLIISLILPALHVWVQDLDALMLLTPEFFRALNNDTFHLMHKLGHNNLLSYVIGMACGSMVYRWQNQGVDITKNKVYARLLWLVFPIIGLMFYSGSIFYADSPRPSVIFRMLYASLHRLIIAVVMAAGLIGMVMKSPMILRNVLEWKGWTFTGRLSYSVYLLHFNFVYVLVGIKTTLGQVSMFNVLVLNAGITCLSYIVAIPLYLLIEGPLNNLVKTCTDSMRKRIK